MLKTVFIIVLLFVVYLFIFNPLSKILSSPRKNRPKIILDKTLKKERTYRVKEKELILQNEEKLKRGIIEKIELINKKISAIIKEVIGIISRIFQPSKRKDKQDRNSEKTKLDNIENAKEDAEVKSEGMEKVKDQ